MEKITPEYRIGSGFDAHRLVRRRDLILGGVRIDSERGLEGHSDADVLVHSICDAILGAVGKGDIGEHFPDTDPAFKGISSMILLEKCRQVMADQGYEIVNLDCTLFAQVPKISPYKDRMKNNIAGCLKMNPDLVNLKATTTEKMGAIGREEGIASQCTLLIKIIGQV